jgi:rubrerythrin
LAKSIKTLEFIVKYYYNISKTNTHKGESMSITIKNLESALAGESQAHIKYRYFAKIAREEGFEDVAKHFEHTADQELKHAWGHLELLIGKPSTRECLEKAIEGETYEYTMMYPDFKRAAEHEGNARAVIEASNQIAESKEHAEEFKAVLAKAEKRFAALQKVEQRHAEAYKQVLEAL